MKGTTMKRRLFLTLPALIGLGRVAFAAEKTLVVGAAVFPDSLRSGTGSYASLSLLLQTNDALLARDNKGALFPSLAESWEQVDPTTTRFHLRKGVKFHDGSDFTSDDVVFTITRVMDPQTAYGMRARISQVAGATAVDPYTVDIKTKTVFPTLLRGLSEIVIEPRHYYEKAGADAVMGHPIGTGPFIFQQWVPGDHYALIANKDYWGGAPKFDKLMIRTIPDGATRVASLVAGESHIVEEVPIDLIDEVGESGSAKVDEISTTVGLVLTFDPTIKPFDNASVREAFDYAIDKPLILKQILKGQGEILQGQVLTKGVLGWNPDLTARPYDPAKAKKMLQDAGYDFNTPVPITTMNGK
jgi:peptide/nickel transport system substrate-binding protein